MLDNLPIATILSLVAVVVVVIGYIRNDLTIGEALVALGAATGGAGVLGVARAQSGKGVRR